MAPAEAGKDVSQAACLPSLETLPSLESLFYSACMGENVFSRVSVENLFRIAESEGEYASSLLKSGDISYGTLAMAARAVYMLTFRAALNIRFEESDRKGNGGCIEPMEQIFPAVDSFVPSAHDPCAYYSLARPAFWFASARIWKSSSYDPANPQSRELKSSLIWRRAECPSSREELVMEYIREFRCREGNSIPFEAYMVSNLKSARGIKNQ